MDIAFIDWPQMLSFTARIALAFLLALPIAWNREREAPHQLRDVTPAYAAQAR